MNPKTMIDLASLIVYLYIIVVIGRLCINRAPGLQMALGKEYSFLQKATDPILIPASRILPPVAGWDELV